jgi:hypothetical protein
MNHLVMTLAARAHRAGRALRSASVRHRRLRPDPFVVVLWQLGAEPFTAVAVGWGDHLARLQMTVAGEPRNRDLAFAALLPFARWFNARFQAPAAHRETFQRGEHSFSRARSAPQLLVANGGTTDLIGRLGRRLAYLPPTGPNAADPALVRLGRHLRFLWLHRGVPGQQLLLAMTDLANDHWATPLSPLERQSLAALDAYLDLPPGVHGFEAAVRAEEVSVGPVPAGSDDERLAPLVAEFNRERTGRTDAAVVGRLLGPITAHFRPLVRSTWELVWRCRDREAALPEARSVARRWDEDRDAYTAHIDWLARGGLRRTRQTARQAVRTIRTLEEAQRLLEAEEACDDPLRMIPYLLQQKAVRGRVLAVDRTHKELATRRMVSRPLVQLHSPDPCLMPVGKELWWTGHPAGCEFVVHALVVSPGGGSLVTLKLMTSNPGALLPAVGAEACFSVHSTPPSPWRFARLPDRDPWTHQPPGADGPAPIETDTPQEVDHS